MAPAARHPELERTRERVKTRRTIQALTVILAAALLAGAGFAAVYLRSYFVARYRGEFAELHDRTLILAPLSGADLASANLQRIDLSGACLRDADLDATNLGAANLAGADLKRASMQGAVLKGANLNHALLDGARLNSA